MAGGKPLSPDVDYEIEYNNRARVPEIAGTIGGDDTILVICRSAAEATTIANRFRTIKGQ